MTKKKKKKKKEGKMVAFELYHKHDQNIAKSLPENRVDGFHVSGFYSGGEHAT